MKEIRYQDEVLERFIPIQLSELIDDLLRLYESPTENKQQLQRFFSLYIRCYHAQTHQQLQSLQDAYLPFSPDRDTLTRQSYNTSEYQALSTSLLSLLSNVLNKANYEQLSEQALNKAMAETSPYGVEVSVDFSIFDEMLLFYRGTALQTEYQRHWKQAFLKKLPVETMIYRRLCILVKPKTYQQKVAELIRDKKLSQKKAEAKATKEMLPELRELKEQKVFIKLFKNIPQSDLEMIFPNTKVKMRLFDKVKLGVTGGGGAVSGIMTVLSKLSVIIDPIAALSVIGGFLGLLWRQIASVFTQRTKYMAKLSKNLYYYNLDNNQGAIAYLVNMAEAEECKEALLAYYFLHQHKNLSLEALDKLIETYIQQQYQTPIDFEVSDGIAKLKTSKLLAETDNKHLKTVDLATAIHLLEQQWLAMIKD